MEQFKPAIYVEEPNNIDTLKKNEIKELQQIYHLTADEITQVFKAVGNDIMKLKDFLVSKDNKATTNQVVNPNPETAINPNPGANANIEAIVENLSPEEIQSQTKAPNSEVTDGEDG